MQSKTEAVPLVVDYLSNHSSVRMFCMSTTSITIPVLVILRSPAPATPISQAKILLQI